MLFENKNKVEVVKNYRIKDPRSDLVWHIEKEHSNIPVLVDGRNDGIREYVEMIKYNRIPKAHCLMFKGKYYCPGAVFKLKEKWVMEHNIRTVFPIHSFGDYNLIINQESFYVEYTFNNYAKKGHLYFRRRWFPFADMSEWEKQNSENRSVHEFIRRFEVPKDMQKEVDIEIPMYEIEEALEIVDGYEWNLEKFPETSSLQFSENKYALLVYIVLMFCSIIFKEPWVLWFIFTLTYFSFTAVVSDRKNGEE